MNQSVLTIKLKTKNRLRLQRIILFFFHTEYSEKNSTGQALKPKNDDNDDNDQRKRSPEDCSGDHRTPNLSVWVEGKF